MRNTGRLFATRILPRTTKPQPLLPKTTNKAPLLLTDGKVATPERLVSSSLSTLNKTSQPTPSVWKEILDDMGYVPKEETKEEIDSTQLKR